ncbi:MAG: hypothetical protein PVF74_05560 [Anaerolineales bacterium]|jgi:hypothetical protein
MRKESQTAIGILRVRFLQIILVSGMLICVGHIVLGNPPSVEIDAILALILLLLLGLLVLAVNWLIFELNRTK